MGSKVRAIYLSLRHIWLEACSLKHGIYQVNALIDHTMLARAARVCVVAAAALVFGATCVSVRQAGEPPASSAPAPVERVAPAQVERVAPAPEPPPPQVKPARAELPGEALFFEEAANAAWKQFDALWIARTGLASATPDYDRLTPWDIASVLAANYSAHRLGLLPEADYEKRMHATLRTLATMPLYRKAVFHKMYFARTAQMVGRSGKATSVGYGWSATDLGRLLNWLRIIAETEPELRAEAQRVARRIKFSETVKDGYMWGGLLGTRGKLWRFQEGRIGYEQYAAEGFSYWGASVANARDINKNAKAMTVLGVPILADTRGLDRLNSEPFVLMGMEIGFTPGMEELARNVLAAQQARFEQTGKLTMVSEDAVSVPPYYFYYYCVLCNGRTFTVDVAEVGKHLDKPRWVSTKASFGYHTLFGTEYTRRVIEAVAKAKTRQGWNSGMFEESLRPTNTYDVNTAAVVLEAALYRKLGRPFVEAGAR